jgi:hypothetical protein
MMRLSNWLEIRWLVIRLQILVFEPWRIAGLAVRQDRGIL